MQQTHEGNKKENNFAASGNKHLIQNIMGNEYISMRNQKHVHFSEKPKHPTQEKMKTKNRMKVRGELGKQHWTKK